MAGRLTLGLYNSYDPRRFTEAHRRALVRAAPLALAFDANLAAFGFPFDDLAAHGGRTAEARTRQAKAPRGMEAPPEARTPEAIAAYVAGTTSVAGAGGPSGEASGFVELARLGRFLVWEAPRKGFPPQLGALVATTEHARARATTPRRVAEDLLAGRSQLVLFGLGPHGLPEAVLAEAGAQLDVTGRHVGLETATAMGAVAGSLHAWMEALAASDHP